MWRDGHRFNLAAGSVDSGAGTIPTRMNACEKLAGRQEGKEGRKKGRKKGRKEKGRKLGMEM